MINQHEKIKTDIRFPFLLVVVLNHIDVNFVTKEMAHVFIIPTKRRKLRMKKVHFLSMSTLGAIFAETESDFCYVTLDIPIRPTERYIISEYEINFT